MRAGGAEGWGFNVYGQLGDGTTRGHARPVRVAGVTSLAAIGPYSSHTCALTTLGRVECWGWNRFGQLGDGTTTERRAPVTVRGLGSGVVSLATGSSDHTCAIAGAGGVKCWGFNLEAELGDGTTATRVAPVDVSGLSSGVVAIAAGADYTCALTTAGGVKCWGHNVRGQLGDGTRTDRRSPVDVVGLGSAVVAVAAGGQHTCVLTRAGAVDCWGENGEGELGDGTRNGPRVAPVRVRLGECLVPHVVGRFLAGAETRVVGAGCRVGRVAGRISTRKLKGRVLEQRPRAGMQRASARAST